MRRYALTDPASHTHESLTPEEKQAWVFPLADSYHSFHIERMGADTFRVRDSRTATVLIGSHFELMQFIWTALTPRKADPHFENGAAITILTQEEIDDLLSDL